MSAHRRSPESPPRNDPVVPLVDGPAAERIYDPSIHRLALLGALLGAVLLGVLGHGLAEGWLAVAGLGQWAVSGPLVGAFTGAGLGAAAGGLVGALTALYRMPPRGERAGDGAHDRSGTSTRPQGGSP